jgi:hypothetical protein
VTAKEVCARFNIGRGTLRRARESLALSIRLTDEDLVQMALLRAERPLRASEIIEFIDWVDHSRWSDDYAARVLDGLVAAGKLQRSGDSWTLVAEWP